MMDAESPLSVFDSVRVVNLRPGDIVLFRCQVRLNESQRDRALQALNEVFPHHESMILESGQDIAVMRPEPGLFGRMWRWLCARRNNA
jgi:hypothetical protein